MRLVHLVLFRLDATPEQEAALQAAFDSLTGTIPELLAFSYGRNVSTRDAHFTHALHSEFADFEALGRYLVHPAHEALVQELLQPVMTERRIVDYWVPAAAARS